MLHWNYKTGLTLADVLHLQTLASEVRSIGTAASRAHEQLLRGTVADDELERLRPARFVPKRGQTAGLMSFVPPEAGCQGAGCRSSGAVGPLLTDALGLCQVLVCS
jgi:hypothetical protein